MFKVFGQDDRYVDSTAKDKLILKGQNGCDTSQVQAGGSVSIEKR